MNTPRPRTRARIRRAGLGVFVVGATLLGLGCQTRPAPSTEPTAPATPRGLIVDDYHGTAVADPYRWLEELDADTTRSWIGQQNEISEPYLDALPVRAFFQRTLDELAMHRAPANCVSRGSRGFSGAGHRKESTSRSSAHPVGLRARDSTAVTSGSGLPKNSTAFICRRTVNASPSP